VTSTHTAAPALRPGLPRSLTADPGFGPLPGLLLILTAVTGVVDAVSILALGRVFVANMTGNVVFAGFAVVGAPGFSLSASLFALAGFLAGAAIGGALISRAARDRGALLRAGAAAELALAAAALLVAALSGAPGASHGTTAVTGGAFGPAVTDALAALLAVAMGIQNAVARKLAVPDLTTTVLTMTLTGLGADLRAVLRGSTAPAQRATSAHGTIPAHGTGPAHGAGRGRGPGGGPRRARPPPARGRHHAGRRRRRRLARPRRERSCRAEPGHGPARGRGRRRRARHTPPRRLAHPAGLGWRS
jgi:uncharacterized membrane protein YoaK (UPF0700 family)